MRLRQDEDIRLTKLKNGWEVEYSWEESFTDRGGHKDTDWKNEAYAFPTLEEAIGKMSELALTIKD